MNKNNRKKLAAMLDPSDFSLFLSAMLLLILMIPIMLVNVEFQLTVIHIFSESGTIIAILAFIGSCTIIYIIAIPIDIFLEKIIYPRRKQRCS